jgi:ribosomal-protein-serine acetyltransferase
MGLQLSDILFYKSPRVLIHHWNSTHIESLAEAMNESLETLRGHFWWAKKKQYDVTSAAKFITDRKVEWLRHTAFSFGIFDPNEPRIVLGDITLTIMNANYRQANIGYWIRDSARGKGYVPEAVKNIVAFSQMQQFAKEVPIQRYQIMAAESNKASRRVAEKVGFNYEGVFPALLRINDEAVSAAIYSLVP